MEPNDAAQHFLGPDSFISGVRRFRASESVHRILRSRHFGKPPHKKVIVATEQHQISLANTFGRGFADQRDISGLHAGKHGGSINS